MMFYTILFILSHNYYVLSLANAFNLELSRKILLVNGKENKEVNSVSLDLQ